MVRLILDASLCPSDADVSLLYTRRDLNHPPASSRRFLPAGAIPFCSNRTSPPTPSHPSHRTLAGDLISMQGCVLVFGGAAGYDYPYPQTAE